MDVGYIYYGFDFSYSMSARFNEAERLNERYVKFRPTELQRIAGNALEQDYCPDIAKLAEGGFNKVFLLRAKNGREVVARIPTPVAGPPHYTTASEVATMDFLRDILKLPVPKVLAYSTSSDNPIGAEYILMERVEGESLSSRWLSLTTEEVKEIMTQIANMERKIFDFHFPAYGCLFHKKDLGEETQIPIVEDFCIGPVSARQFWHGERRKTEIDRGPCRSLAFPLTLCSWLLEIEPTVKVLSKTMDSTKLSTRADHCYRAISCRLCYLRSSSRDGCHSALCQSSASPNISPTNQL